MKNNRRDFIRLSGLGGLGVLSSSFIGCKTPADILTAAPAAPSRPQRFNMSGYAAPKLDTVRIGFIGLGM